MKLCMLASHSHELETYLQLKEQDQKHRRTLSLMASWKESERPSRPNFQHMEIHILKYYRCDGWPSHFCFHMTHKKKFTVLTFDCPRVLTFCLTQVLSLPIFWPSTLTLVSLWSKTKCEIPSNIWKPLFCGLNIPCLFSLLFGEQSPNPWPF